MDDRGALVLDVVEARALADRLRLGRTQSELEPERFRPCGDRLARVLRRGVLATKDVDEVDRLVDLCQRARAADAVHLFGGRVHWQHAEALRDQVAHHAVARAGGVRRGAHHRDHLAVAENRFGRAHGLMLPAGRYPRPVSLAAVLFDVDFTIAKPGPDLGPEGYQRLAARHGFDLDPARYDEARRAALETLERHPELEHDEEVWVLFTERIIRGMGGDSEHAYGCAVEMTRAWEHAHNFDLYEDVLPTLADLRGRGLKLGLVSNTARDLDAFVLHHSLDVDAALSSRAHGRVKPHESIFRAVLGELEVEAPQAAMVGDSPEDDVAGAQALGMRAFLVDRDSRFPDADNRLTDLRQLPAALELS